MWLGNITEYMNGLQIDRLLSAYTKQTSKTVFPNETRIAFLNVAKDEVCKKAEEINEGYFTMEQYLDLVDGRRQYALPSWIMNRVESVSVKMTGWEDYRIANEVMLSMLDRDINEEMIVQTYSDRPPSFLIRRTSLYLLTASPVVDSVDGLHMWAKMWPADKAEADLSGNVDWSVAPTDNSVGIPRTLHELIVRRASILYKNSLDRPIPLTEQEGLYGADLKDAIDGMANQNIMRSITPIFPYNDGSNY